VLIAKIIMDALRIQEEQKQKQDADLQQLVDKKGYALKIDNPNPLLTPEDFKV
jgi:hypothetical protein